MKTGLVTCLLWQHKKYCIPESLLPNIHEEPPEKIELVDRVLLDM